MKGVIFNILEDFVNEKYGDYFFDALLEKITLRSDGVFVGPGTYPDEDFETLFEAIIKQQNLNTTETLRAFGKYLFFKLMDLYPDYITTDARSFIKSVDSIIHVEVKKLYPAAILPSFDYEDVNEKTLRMIYKSKRKYADLLDGLLDGTSEYYSNSISFKRVSDKMEEDIQVCEYEIKF